MAINLKVLYRVLFNVLDTKLENFNSACNGSNPTSTR